MSGNSDDGYLFTLHGRLGSREALGRARLKNFLRITTKNNSQV